VRAKPRPELQSLKPYSSSDIIGGRIFLHANENPYPVPQPIMDEIVEATRALSLNRYPDPDPVELRELLADYNGVDQSQIWIGDGANEVLLQSCLAYGGPGRKALVFEPTYVMHHRQARMAGTNVVEAKRTDEFDIDIDDALATVEIERPDIVFVCTPNNPTGNVTALEDLRRIADVTHGLVICDEAYFEFCGVTVVPSLADLPNVIAVRTLSKAFRFAGVRFGYGVAGPELLEQLGRVRMPYAQSSFTQTAARIVLRHRDEVLQAVDTIVSERGRVEERVAELPDTDVTEGGANFVFFTHPDASRLIAGLAGKGIIVRDFTMQVPGAVRVTVGTPAENDEFLETLTGLM